jgi:hypothetical protein
MNLKETTLINSSTGLPGVFLHNNLMFSDIILMVYCVMYSKKRHDREAPCLSEGRASQQCFYVDEISSRLL